jgi:hypothetical protein
LQSADPAAVTQNECHRRDTAVRTSLVEAASLEHIQIAHHQQALQRAAGPSEFFFDRFTERS